MPSQVTSAWAGADSWPPLLRRAEETGCAMVRIVGAESMATVPFAPFVDLLPVSHG